MSFAPGEAYQFDWSHETITLQGLPLMVKAAHMKLSHSRMPFVRTYFRETQELVFDAHDKACPVLRWGLPARYLRQHEDGGGGDLRRQKPANNNRRFLQMCSHHLIEPVACTPASGWEKGQVENQVGNLRDQFFRPKPPGEEPGRVERLAGRSVYRLRTAHQKHPEFKERTIWEVFQEEQRRPDGTARSFRRVRREGGASHYHMPDHGRSQSRQRRCARRRADGASVSHAERIVVLLGDEVVADHPRHFRRDQIIYDPWHYLPVLMKKPGALRKQRAVQRLGSATRADPGPRQTEEPHRWGSSVRQDPGRGARSRPGSG